MPLCPTCQAQIPVSARFCPACGSPAPAASPLTEGVTAELTTPRRIPQPANQPPTRTPLRTPTSITTSTGSTTRLEGERFHPGQLLLSRYRIIELIGKGGMGEVYRADDITLGQTVALKFLTPELSSDAERVQKLIAEVRTTRQVSHPNVCRVYDIVELPAEAGDRAASGASWFISMEFIDGENLASLLRRIGRLPSDKCVELARQICAGLHAAHEQGVIHRDIKPSNIMIDGRGRARVTDFGVAAGLEEIRASGDIAVGTPGYMAPEQLAGESVSIRSDIYALGLVLYEMFTGRPAFKASSIAELRALHESSRPASPSTIIDSIDPAAERVILRCLSRDPEDRPASTIAVSAALPGGDPLAAALAAGETPSPELIAASGASGVCNTRMVVFTTGAFAVGLIISILLAGHLYLVNRIPFEYSLDTLTSRTRDFIKAAGYTDPPEDFASGFRTNSSYFQYVEATDTSADRWKGLESGHPAAVHFWYRQSNQRIIPAAIWTGVPTWDDPPQAVPGDIRMLADTTGALLRFEVVPRALAGTESKTPESQAPPTAAKSPVDWNPFFKAAGLDPANFKSTESILTPPVGSDTRLAWTGPTPAEPAKELRVEAASDRGRPVFFRALARWTLDERTEARGANRLAGLANILKLFTLLTALGVAIFLGWRSIRSGKGDRKGAFRLAAFMFISQYLFLTLPQAKLTNVFAASNIEREGARALWMAAITWLFYIALEPYIRRIRPQAIVSWTRLLSGHFRDPAIGRDIMVGGAFAAVGVMMYDLMLLGAPLVGLPPISPITSGWHAFGPPRAVVGFIADGLAGSAIGPLIVIMLLVTARWLFRRDLAASAVVVIICALYFGGTNYADARVGVPVATMLSTLYAIALVRFGLLALSSMFFFHFLIQAGPVTPNISTAWFAPNFLIMHIIAIAIMSYAAMISLGNRAARQAAPLPN